MEFYSTRGEGPVSGARAIVNGIAGDGGLYVPAEFPVISQEELEDMVGLEYPERAAYIIGKYLTEFTYDELLSYTKKAYDRFDGYPAPLTKVDEGAYIMELWHGPTYAFKDVALTLLPHLLTGSKKKEGADKKTLILVATSGDTGKAALEGFKDVENTEIVVLYPSEGVSDMQKLQMVTTDGSNTHVIGIKGNFDDAQTAVKKIFASAEMKKKFAEKGYELSSANSINFGRLVPQIVYYFSSYLDLLAEGEIEPGERIDFVVPSGNFGNILAGYYAKRMGLPIKQLIVASNVNNVLTEFFETGVYNARRTFHKTMSPSMDILVSSNLERLVYEMLNRESDKVAELMKELSSDGCYSVDEDTLYDAAPEFLGYFSTEEETKEVIGNVFDEYGYLLDPHTAVAVSAYFKFMNDVYDDASAVILSTANPYKFPQSVLEAISETKEDDAFKAVKKLAATTGAEVPEGIAGLKEKPVLHDLVVDKEDIAEAVLAAIKG